MLERLQLDQNTLTNLCISEKFLDIDDSLQPVDIIVVQVKGIVRIMLIVYNTTFLPCSSKLKQD